MQINDLMMSMQNIGNNVYYLTFLRVFLLLEPTKTTSYQTTETP